MGANSHYRCIPRGRYIIYQHKVVCRDDDVITGSTVLYDVYDSQFDRWIGTYPDYGAANAALLTPLLTPLKFRKDEKG